MAGTQGQPLRRGTDHFGNLLDDLADLVLGDDQRRGQHQRVASDPCSINAELVAPRSGGTWRFLPAISQAVKSC